MDGCAHVTVTQIFSVFHCMERHVFLHESEGTEVTVHQSLAPTF